MAGLGDAHHLLVGQRLLEAVGDPVAVFATAPGDDLDLAAVGVDRVFASVGGRGFGRVVEDRRVFPAADPLHAEVIQFVFGLVDGDHPVGGMPFPVLVLQVVDARIDDVFVGVGFLVGGAGGQAGRVED